MINKYFLASVLCGSMATVNAAQYGMGASFKDGDSAVYLPVAISKNVILEPYLNFFSYKYNSQTDRIKNSCSGKKIGLGIFKTQAMQNNVGTYFGIRLALLENESTYSRENWDESGSGEESSFLSEYKSDGYAIEPVVGVSYAITPQISIAAEAKYEYNKYDSSTSDFSTSEGEANLGESNGSDAQFRSNIIIRYLF